MNVKTTTLIRESCSKVGIQILHGGAWFSFGADKRIEAADPIGAVLIVENKIPAGIDPANPETLMRPGLIRAACETLGVDAFWLYRFWMGYDRGFLIRFVNDKDVETRDDVSEFGISLAKELFP